MAKTFKGSWSNALENFGNICSADLLKTTLMFVPQYRLILQVNLRWDICAHPQKEQTSLIYPKTTLELIASFFWCETTMLICKYPERLPRQ